MKIRYKELLLAIATVVLAYVGANAIERSFIQVLHLSLLEWTWISDVVLSGLLGAVTFIWLNLRAIQKNLIRAEKIQSAIETELSLAAEIQRNLLPSTPSQSGGIRWGAELKPAGKIGGDFYDFIPIDADSMLVLIADVSGKGIPAALTLASVRTLFRMLSHETRDPAVLLSKVSAALYDEHQGAVFLTCIAGLFDFRKNLLTYVNAGHPPGIILTADQTDLLECGGTPLGMFSSSSFQKISLPLETGMLGILLTDGVTEAIPVESGSIPEFMRLTMLGRSQDCHPQEMCESLLDLVNGGSGLTGDSDWRDDQTVLVFRVESKG